MPSQQLRLLALTDSETPDTIENVNNTKLSYLGLVWFLFFIGI